MAAVANLGNFSSGSYCYSNHADHLISFRILLYPYAQWEYKLRDTTTTAFNDRLAVHSNSGGMFTVVGASGDMKLHIPDLATFSPKTCSPCDPNLSFPNRPRSDVFIQR